MFRYVNERHKTFEAVEKILPPTCVVAFNKWKSAQLNELLQAVNSYSREDAEPLLELIPVIVPETYFGTQVNYIRMHLRYPDIIQSIILFDQGSTARRHFTLSVSPRNNDRTRRYYLREYCQANLPTPSAGITTFFQTFT